MNAKGISVMVFTGEHEITTITDLMSDKGRED